MHSILAVDDSASMRQMVTFTLKSAGYNVVEAVDGQDAWEKSSTRDFDLVLTDQNMPRMDGISLTKKLRDNPKFKTTPILILTTESSDQMKQAGRGAGCHRLAGQALRPGQAARGHQESREVVRANKTTGATHMAEMTSDGANQSAGIDLSQFYQVFFEEAGENLDRMEQQLLEINIESADDEELNSIFRCAHSVKGGAATFGFGDVAELTHQMETLLDKLRRRELTPPRRWSTCCCSRATRCGPSSRATRAPAAKRSTPRICSRASARWSRASPHRRRKSAGRCSRSRCRRCRCPRTARSRARSSCAWARSTTPTRPIT
jgi:two-component system chemotaxis response regulator CheY